VSVKLFLVLVLMAIAWVLIYLTLFVLFVFGDCFNPQCQTQQTLTSRVILGVAVASYLVCAGLLIRSGESR
jgi:hypothetical protein